MMLLFQPSLYPSWRDLALLMPELQLILFAAFALIIDILLPRDKRRFIAYFSLLGVLFASTSLLVLYISQRDAMPRLAFYNMYMVDNFAIIFKAILLLGLGITILLSIKYLDVEGEQHGEYYSLMLFAAVGMLLMVSGYDFLCLYVSLELMAISAYILVGYLKKNTRSNEAALKYYILGAFSSAILLYGISFLYGLTAHTNLRAISLQLSTMLQGPGGGARYLVLLAVVLVSVGLLFKIAAVPFHMWVPDAYEGAPTPITAFMSVGVKTASYAMLARILLIALPELRVVDTLPGWTAILSIIAVITITFGNIAAMTQTNLKRLLAYSSISHAGYILLGIISDNQIGYMGIIIYLFTYTVMNLGAFGVVIALRREDIEGEHISAFNGLIKHSPVMAVMMVIFLLSLAGIPPTAGFMGKYFILAGLIKAGNSWFTKLAVIAVLNTVIGLYYYARIIRAIFNEPLTEQRPLATNRGLEAVLILMVILTIGIGIYPQPLINVSEAAVKQLFPVQVSPAPPQQIDATPRQPSLDALNP